MAATEVGCKLSSVNFCPAPASHDAAHSSFSGGIAPPDAFTQYTDVCCFCEFLRTTAVLNGDHTVRRAWVACLRGAAHFWFYHSLSMGTRKHLADANIDEVIHALMYEFGGRGACLPELEPPLHSDKGSFSSSNSSTSTRNPPQITLSVRPATGYSGRSPSLSPIPPAGRPLSHATGGHSPGRRSPSRSPRPHGDHQGCRNPRSPARDGGLSFAGYGLDGQFDITRKGATVDGQACHRYPTHQDVARHQAEEAAGGTNENGKDKDKRHATRQRLSETPDQPMADAPRTPNARSCGQRGPRQQTPDAQRTPIRKAKKSAAKLSIRDPNLNDGLIPFIEPCKVTRRARKSSSS